ncbi:reducing polyketide synthase sphB [Aspergillus lucknowensis]|uniref:Polyketide synthase n=1 Tax=Aspergillus lucknowensis TaxID=176173 RepID=A0ABR4LY52_9EURO
MPNDTTPRTGKQEASPWMDDPIAIVGIGLRLPGSIRTPQQYWEFLTKKGSGRCRVPANRYNVDAFLGPKGKPGHTCTEYGYFLDDLDLTAVDSSFWSMPPKELELLDPQQRLIMEVIYECLESSGTSAYSGKDIGCYVGVLGEDWMEIQTKDPHHAGTHHVAGYGDFAISNRVSKELGLTGPSMTIRTACSSSLMALHTACQSIYAGECSSAVVGGCNLILSPRMTVAMSEYRVISPTGYCRSFDADADGYARGEAVNAIHIKRLSHALRDGDPIRAVIRSACLNSDGQRSPPFIPSPESHELLIRRSHQLAGITDLSQTAMIECHGTGTIVGDTLEGRAVAKVFGELGGVLIGSVKPNIGHSEGASGLSSLIKMVLALENQTIPPNINFTTPNPKIPFGPARLRVPVECEPWPKGKAERVGLNGFGIGGANGHVLLESTRSFVGSVVNGDGSGKPPSQLLVFSATHSKTVDRNITKTLEYLSLEPARGPNASYTLACRRKRFPNRAFAVGSMNSWDVSPIQKVGPAPDLVWVFTGQGAQYPGMGRELLTNIAIAGDTIQHLDEVLDSINPGRLWTLHEELIRPEASSRLFKAEYSQPCCTALQIALVDVLKSMDVKPSVVVGHSAGEIAAAYAAGALTADDAITIAYHRGQVATRAENSGKGGMMAVSLGREEVSRLLTDGVTIACENSPNSVTLSGDVTALDVVAGSIQSRHPNVPTKRLPVNCAYHSVQMKGVEEDYLGLLSGLDVSGNPLSAQFVSSVTGKRVHNAMELGAEYWSRNLTSPVLFNSAITGLLAEHLQSNPLFVEVGPHSALSRTLNDIAVAAHSKSIPYIPTLVRESNAYDSILFTAGRLFQSNTTIDLSTLCTGTTLPDLPPYQWQYDSSFWSESRVSRNWRFRQHPNHDILGSKVPDCNDEEPIWRSLIYLENITWVRDHMIDGNIVFPRAGYISLAGEAVCQLFGCFDFSMRNVTFLEDLGLRENRSTEIMTQLRPSKITLTQDSAWYDFTISSFFDGVWSKHCTGQVRRGRQVLLNATRPLPGARKVKPEVWHRAMKRLGVIYGSRFNLTHELSASVIHHEATAVVTDTREAQESSYIIHPATLDATFQLFSVAESQGIARHFDRLAMPTYIDEIYIRSPSGPIIAQTAIEPTETDTTSGNLLGFCDKDLVFSMSGVRLSHLKHGSTIRDPDPHAGARLVWKPDIDEVDIASLVRPTSNMSDDLLLIEELALACIIETHHQTRNIVPSLPHYVKFHQWLSMQRKRAEQGTYEYVPACQSISLMSSVERTNYIDSIHQKALGTDARYVATAITRVYRHSAGLFQNQIDPLSLLMKDELLTAIYGFAQLCDFADFFRVFAHNRPCMRVLEIGAGTGGVTATILPALRGPNGERLYDSYTYTDISAGFFDTAQERFSGYDGIIYRSLDITRNPETQGFDPSSYDLIIASNVLHATPSLQQTLGNVRSLLKADGKLFLQELAPVTKWINFIMGTLPGWWLGGPDGRIWEPYVSPERWDAELRTAGLSVADAVIHDGRMNAHIISSVQTSSSGQNIRVTVLCEDVSSAVDRTVSVLHARGFTTDVCRLGDDRPANQIVISLLELDSPQLHSVAPEKYLDLRNMISSLDTTPMLWVTRSSQLQCRDPRYAPTLGLLRTARRELAVTVATLELDNLDENALGAVATVARRLLFQDSPHRSVDPVLEYAYAHGTLMVGQFYPAPIGEELLDKTALVEGCSDARVLGIGAQGEIETLHWKPKAVSIPASADDWIEIETRAVGLDLSDLLVAAGSIESPKFGRQSAGIVRRVGPGVKNLRVGDRVVTLAAGTCASRLITSEKLCARMARNLNWAEAATMPCAFTTALYSLIDVARLKHGDTVLIHSASTGIGLAAIQVCQIIGAQIYCTAQSQRETDYLVKQGIPRECVFHCGDTSFLHDVSSATRGRGVDVVLNSLSGDLLHASWQCVTEFGIMVELGKRDLVGKSRLAMDIFDGNRKFAAVDLDMICARKPEIIQGLLRRCMHHYALGELSPLPSDEFTAANVQQAFRCMQNDSQIGTAALLMPEEASTLPVVLDRRTPQFRSDACHLIVGGLGGLGRSVSSWMSLHGARHFVFFSPSAGSKEEDEYVLELRAQGCHVDLVSGDVSRDADVDALIRHLGENTPIAGIIQASMALAVTSLDNMSFEQWQKSFAPKVHGTWNVHNALLKHGRSVDYFVLFSSLAGLVGQTGHANYAAGNSFLDAFVQYRHSLGLACSAINIGVMEDVGYVSNQPHVIEHFQATSAHMLHEQDLLDTIQLAIDNSLPPRTESKREVSWPTYTSLGQICIGLRSTGPLDSPTNRTSWRRDPRMAVYHNFNKEDGKNSSARESDSSNDDTLERFLAQAKLKPEILQEQASADLLGQEIGKALFNLMLRDQSDLDLDVALASLGADSLLAIKLRDWCRRKAGVDITVVDILSSGSLRKLGEKAVHNLATKIAST